MFKREVIFFVLIILVLPMVFAGECGRILNNGDANKKINFIFVAENYFDKESFLNQAKDFIGLDSNIPFTLLNYVPYNEFKNDYNFYYYFSENTDYECGASATVIPGDRRICFNVDEALTKLFSECGKDMLEVDFIIFISNKNYRSSADVYGLEEIDVKTRILRLSLNSEVPEEKKEFYKEEFKKVVIHEFGHSLGGLSDEYFEMVKDAYKPISPIGALNIDIAGCPKWCSGELNTNAPYFQNYLSYQECIIGLNAYSQNDDIKFKECFDKITPESFSQDFGIGCEVGSGCFWSAQGTNGFRSIGSSIMSGCYDCGLGAINEKLARENIQNLIDSKKIVVEFINLNIKNISLQKEEREDNLNAYTFRIDFNLTNQDGKPILFKDNNHNYILKSDGIILRDLKEKDYYLIYEYAVSKKDRDNLEIEPGEKVDLNFNIKYNDVELNKVYNFDLYNVKINNNHEIKDRDSKNHFYWTYLLITIFLIILILILFLIIKYHKRSADNLNSQNIT